MAANSRNRKVEWESCHQITNNNNNTNNNNIGNGSGNGSVPTRLYTDENPATTIKGT
jgi:hypothetical protein